MAIVVEGLHKSFGDVPAVQDLSLEAPDGAVTGFLGRNGAGKSTTMRCVLGFLRHTRGRCLVNGRPYLTLDHPGWQVGAVLDPAAHHPGRTGRAHLLVLARAGGLSDRRVDEVLDLVELTSAADRRVAGYSLGMRQRLHLAGALLGDPATLVLDEPTNGLDPPGIAWLRNLLHDLADQGRCVLLSSHVLGEVAQTVDRIVVVAQGSDIAAGTLEEVLTSGGRAELRVDGPDRAAIIRLVEAGGGTVTDVLSSPVHVRGVSRESLAREALRERVLLTHLAPVDIDLEQRFLELTDPSRQPR